MQTNQDEQSDKEQLIEFAQLMFEAGKELSAMYQKYDGDQDWTGWLSEHLPKTGLDKEVETYCKQQVDASLYKLASSITTDGGDAYYQNVPIQRYSEQLSAELNHEKEL